MTTTKTTKSRSRTVALPAGFELRHEDGSWLLYGYGEPIAIDRTRAITIEISEGSGLPFLFVPMLADEAEAEVPLPFAALARLRRVFPAWTVDADEETWVRIFEMKAFVAALRIS